MSLSSKIFIKSILNSYLKRILNCPTTLGKTIAKNNTTLKKSWNWIKMGGALGTIKGIKLKITFIITNPMIINPM